MHSREGLPPATDGGRATKKKFAAVPELRRHSPPEPGFEARQSKSVVGIKAKGELAYHVTYHSRLPSEHRAPARGLHPKIFAGSLTNLSKSSRLPLFLIRGEEPCDSCSFAVERGAICFVARRKDNVSSRQRNPASLRPQQRNSLRELLKSVLRPVARYEDSRRESRAARRSLAASGFPCVFSWRVAARRWSCV
jgi:hypothetical protein